MAKGINTQVIQTWGWGWAVESVNGQTGVVVLDTVDIAETTNKNYITDAQQEVLNNTSWVNTWDQKYWSFTCRHVRISIDSVQGTINHIRGIKSSLILIHCAEWERTQI
jgi:hypothetical protein